MPLVLTELLLTPWMAKPRSALVAVKGVTNCCILFTVGAPALNTLLSGITFRVVPQKALAAGLLVEQPTLKLLVPM